MLEIAKRNQEDKREEQQKHERMMRHEEVKAKIRMHHEMLA